MASHDALLVPAWRRSCWLFDQPVLVLAAAPPQVTQVKTEEREGYTSVQLGCGAKRRKQVPASLAGHFEAAGLPIKRRLAEFRVTPDALLPVGTELRASHFVAGQYVDVSGTSIGKGFQVRAAGGGARGAECRWRPGNFVGEGL